MKFVLQTDRGEFVAEGQFPPHQNTAPDVVVWGDRYFRLIGTVAPYQYRETYPFFAISGVNVLI